MTTHYLDEAEHCHRIAVIHAGKLAALGTASALKSRFSDRPIVEIQPSDPVGTMTALDALPEVEKTSLFGTAVHAVLQIGRRRRRDRGSGAEAQRAGDRIAHRACRRRSRTSSSTWSSRCRPKARHEEDHRRGAKEFRQIGRDRRTLLILLFVPAMFLLLYGYALNFDIRDVRLAVEDRDRTPAEPRR